MLINEAGETYKTMGLNAAKSLTKTAGHILNADEGSRNNLKIKGSDLLGDFVSQWKQIRSQDKKEAEKATAVEKLAADITQKNTIGIADYLNGLKNSDKTQIA